MGVWGWIMGGALRLNARTIGVCRLRLLIVGPLSSESYTSGMWMSSMGSQPPTVEAVYMLGSRWERGEMGMTGGLVATGARVGTLHDVRCVMCKNP